MAAYDDLDVKRIFAVGVFSVVLTAVTALAVQVLYFALVRWQEVDTQNASNYNRQNRILAEQEAEITTYGVDAETGNIVIPVEAAFELMVSDTKENEIPEGQSDET